MFEFLVFIGTIYLIWMFFAGIYNFFAEFSELDITVAFWGLIIIFIILTPMFILLLIEIHIWEISKHMHYLHALILAYALWVPILYISYIAIDKIIIKYKKIENKIINKDTEITNIKNGKCKSCGDVLPRKYLYGPSGDYCEECYIKKLTKHKPGLFENFNTEKPFKKFTEHNPGSLPLEMEIVEEIIERFREQGFAQGAINKFGFVSDVGESIIVSRMHIQNTSISRNEILSAVQAVRGNHELYNGSVTEFRNVLVEKYDINRRIYQSLYALIRILPLNEITRE